VQLTNGAHGGTTAADAQAARSAGAAAQTAHSGAGTFALLVGIVVGALAVAVPAEVVVAIAVARLIAIAAFPLSALAILVAVKPIVVVEVAVPTPICRPICNGSNWISTCLERVTCLELGSACWLNAVQSKKRAGGEVVSNLSKCVLGLLVQGS